MKSFSHTDITDTHFHFMNLQLLSNFKSLSNSMFERADRVFESLNQVAYCAEVRMRVSQINSS